MPWPRLLAWSAMLPGLLSAANPPAPQFQLPDVVAPHRYALDLTIVPSEPAFHGVVTIDIELKENLSFLWLNGKDLIIESALLRMQERVLHVRVVPGGPEFLGFSFPLPVGPGMGRLEIRYRGKLSGRATVGAFRRQEAGDWYVFTSFTAIDARRAFPCFDEPRYKTPWSLTLHVRRKEMALANMSPLRESEEPGGMKRVEFGETLPLPSSLVAFAVGPFEAVDAGRAGMNGTPVRIITPRGRTQDARAAASLTAVLLPRLEDYTGIPYPFGKLDHLALLEGPFGATEYPGLITYRQRILLARSDADSPERRTNLSRIMAHELAHQWFGNLVTMSSWRDVWLSEGFATWMGAKVINEQVAPVLARHRIMSVDSPAARSVRREMRSRAEMRDVYSPLVYQKGAAALGTIEQWLGSETFRRGIRLYLTAHKFAGATTADVIGAISQAAGKDVGEMLVGFLDRSGYPVVTAEIHCDPAPRVKLRQDSMPWRLPVCFKAEGAAVRCVVMEGRDIEVPMKACPAWVFPNAGASGYYRTKLSPDLLESVWRQGSRQLTAAERVSLAFDVPSMTATPATLAKMAQDEEPLVAIVAMALAGTFGAR